MLMGGLEPQADAKELGLKCGISCSMAGWYTERHPKLDPVATMTDGVFVAGACQGPKDIPASVAQGAAAAARVHGHDHQGHSDDRADRGLDRRGGAAPAAASATPCAPTTPSSSTKRRRSAA